MISWLACLALAQASDSVHLDALLVTEIPLVVGVESTVELPGRLRAGLGVGVLPRPYLNVINGVAVGAGWYGEPVADLIDTALSGALVLSPKVGWRAWKGVHFDLGYRGALVAGGITGTEALAAAVGSETTATGTDNSALSASVGATDHMFTVQTGYQLIVKERLVFDFTLGGSFTVAAQAKVDIDDASSGRLDRGRERWEAAETASEVLLVDMLKSYVHTPTVGIGIGYRFF